MTTYTFRAVSLTVVALCLSSPEAWTREATAKVAPIVCREPALVRTDCLIRAALDDLAKTYKNVGGGGISEIKQLSTYSYRISISQEERIDQVTYEFGVKPKSRFVILKRRASTDEP